MLPLAGVCLQLPVWVPRIRYTRCAFDVTGRGPRLDTAENMRGRGLRRDPAFLMRLCGSRQVFCMVRAWIATRVLPDCDDTTRLMISAKRSAVKRTGGDAGRKFSPRVFRKTCLKDRASSERRITGRERTQLVLLSTRAVSGRHRCRVISANPVPYGW